MYTIALSACGGSGSGDTGGGRPPIVIGPTPPSTGTLTPIIDGTSVQVFGDQQSNEGASVGFAVIPKNNVNILALSWTQTAGPAVNLLARTSQTIGFDVPSAGTYTFTLNLQLTTGNESYTVSLSAQGPSTSAGNIRLDHTVTELGKVSLHAGQAIGKEIDSVTWAQTSGPQAQSIIEDSDFLFFDAPAVTQDSVISYQANISYSDGTTATDDVYITVKNVDFDSNSLFFSNNSVITEDMHAYQTNSQYKQSLERCVYNNFIPGTPNCTFNDLPLIGSVTDEPSVQDILDRTLVSHDWMGDRFAEFLQNSPAGPDMLNLLRGVTGIVISYDVRPSFYWAATGAIYLDANSFWRTPSERDTLNDVPDYRTNFGSELQFRFFWRYVKNNQQYPANFYSKQERNERAFADLEASLSWLMYHELAHANDFFPPRVWASISPNQTPLSYFNSNGATSDVLANTFPLRSNEMHQLAQVRFRNITPTTAQKNYTGSDVEGFFTPDISPSFYSYLTDREDFATLVERFMMLYRLQADSDVAVIDGQAADGEYIVTWGQRNRITENSLQDRTVFAVSRVYPELGNISSLIESLPAPILMDTTRGWSGNLVLPASESASANYSEPNFKTMNKRELAQWANQFEFDLHAGKPNLP